MGEAQTDAYVAGLFDALNLITGNPALGRARPEFAEGVRSFPYREHLVFYVVHEDMITVIRVLGAKQSIKTSLFKA